MAAWPASLPQDPLAPEYSERGGGNVVRTQMDVGPPKLRRRYTGEITEYAIGLYLTQAQVATLETFYTTTLVHGTTAFDWKDFRSGASKSYTFASRPIYAPAPNAGDTWHVSFSLQDQP